MYKNYSDVFLSNQDPGAAPVYSKVYNVYLSVVTCAPPPNFYTWRTPCPQVHTPDAYDNTH